VLRISFVVVVVAGCGFSPSANTTGDAHPIDSANDLCAPATTSCDGRVRRTCGADQHWDPALDHSCDFTCSLGACVVPSNVSITDAATCTSAAPALAPPPGAQVTLTAAGSTHITCTPDCGAPGLVRIDPIATTSAPAPGQSWFCLSKLAIPSGTALSLPSSGGPHEAIIFIVDGAVDIAGLVTFDGGAASGALPGGVGAPGGFDGADRSGGAGIDGTGPCGGLGGDHDGSSNHWIGGGGGGGGYASAGAKGGNGRCTNGDHNANGKDGGGICGNPSLIPLVGGSGGGGGGDATTGIEQGWAGGGGGGAIQISSRASISVSGTISARGGTGYGVAGSAGIDGGGGGGAGGGILLEAPAFMVAGQLIVDGGSGGVAGSGLGGAGASGTSPPATGLSFAANGQGGSGGGGAGGRIRLGGMVACTSNVSPVSSCSAAMLAVQP